MAISEPYKIYIASAGSKAIAGSTFVTAVHYKTAVTAEPLIHEGRSRNTVSWDDLFTAVQNLSPISHTLEIPVEDINVSGVKTATQKRLDGLIARVCLAAGIFSLPTVLTNDPEHGTSYRYTVNVQKRCPELIGASAIAYHSFRQHILRFHQIYPDYDWINNSGRITDNHRLGLLRRGPSPLHRQHRCVLELGSWLLMRVRQDDKRVRPFARYLLSEPPWWNKHFSSSFIQEDRTVIKQLLSGYYQNPAYAADLYSERVRQWSIENAPL